MPKGGPEGPKSGNRVPEVDTNVLEVWRKVPGFRYKVQRLDAKSEGCGLNPEGMRKQPKARHKGFGTQLGGSGIDRGCPEQARD